MVKFVMSVSGMIGSVGSSVVSPPHWSVPHVFVKRHSNGSCGDISAAYATTPAASITSVPNAVFASGNFMVGFGNFPLSYRHRHENQVSYPLRWAHFCFSMDYLVRLKKYFPTFLSHVRAFLIGCSRIRARNPSIVRSQVYRYRTGYRFFWTPMSRPGERGYRRRH